MDGESMVDLLPKSRGPGVIVAGVARSGTSWVAKGLSFAKGYTYYREPDNFDYVPGAREGFDWLYLPAAPGPATNDLGYRAHMERALTGRLATAFVMREDPGPLFARLDPRWRILGEKIPLLWFRRPGRLVKLVRSNLALDWLAARFPEMRQVYVIRHPCGQYASWRRLGWTPHPERLLASPELIRHHLAPHVERLRTASSFWERAGAWWGAINSVVYRQLHRCPQRFIVQYEWLCQDPNARFRELYRLLGLEWTAGADAFLTHANQGGDEHPYSLLRDAAQRPGRWKQELTEAEVRECRLAAAPFDLPYYPDLQGDSPTAARATSIQAPGILGGPIRDGDTNG
mgnify:CR=1 FL=1